MRIQDIADLTGVSERQLYRTLRMMSLVGFLRETSPGEMAHTPLSASFVSKPSHLDAAMFLAETAVPSALHMVANTERHGQSREPRHSAYTMAFSTPQSFQSHCQQRSKLQHQWTAFLRDVTNVVDDWAAVGPLDSIDWSGLGDACVVDVSSSYLISHPCVFSHPCIFIHPCSHWLYSGRIPCTHADSLQVTHKSPAHVLALAELYPSLHFVVQTPDPDTIAPLIEESPHGARVMVHERGDGEPQIIKDAAVYLLSFASPTLSLSRLRAHVSRELRAHVGILSVNPAARLVLEITLLPEPGYASSSVERSARVFDMSLFNLMNDQVMELKDVVELVESVRGSNGRLVVGNKIFSRDKAICALEISYQVQPNS